MLRKTQDKTRCRPYSRKEKENRMLRKNWENEEENIMNGLIKKTDAQENRTRSY